MTRRRVKLAWIMNDNARKASLKKRRLGLMKKVNELTILCDLRACLIIFSPDDSEPLVWPSPEMARALIDRFYSLPDMERNKKAMNQETYLKERIGKLQDQLNKIQKKNKDSEMEHLIYYLHHGRMLSDLNPNEIHGLIWYARERISLLEKRSDLIKHAPLRDPPLLPNAPVAPAVEEGAAAATAETGMHAIEAETETAAEAAAEAEAEAEAAVVAVAVPTVAHVVAGGVGSSGEGNYPMMVPQNQYLMDQWFIGSKRNEAPLHMAQSAVGHHQQAVAGTSMMPYHQENPNYGSYRGMGLPVHQYGSFLGGQGSSSTSNPNMEMDLMSLHHSHGSFHGMLAGSGLQQPHHESMTMNPTTGTGPIQMGLGLLPHGAGHQVIEASGGQVELYPPSFVAGGLPVPQGGREGMDHMVTHQQRPQPTGGSGIGSNWMGQDLQLQPHFHGGDTNIYGSGHMGNVAAGQPGLPFGLYGGASSSGEGAIGAPFDFSKAWPDKPSNS